METTEGLLDVLRRDRGALSKCKCTGTVAVVDLTASTRFKKLFSSPDIWVERLYSFLGVVQSAKKEVLENAFIKFLGDGVLLFSKADETESERFVEFAEVLAKKIGQMNHSLDSRYSSEAFAIEFTCAIDHGSDIYLLFKGDPQGLVIDRAFRIKDYLVPNMVGVSSSFLDSLRGGRNKRKFALAGKAYLKGVAEDWQDIYALNSIPTFSTQLSLEHKKNEILTDIWEMGRNDKPIWVVSGAIRSALDEAVGSYSVQHGDSDALIEVIHLLSRLYPDRSVEIVTSQQYLQRTKSSFDNDIVSVSGPYYNIVSRELINRLRLPVNFELEPDKLNKWEDPILTFIGPHDDIMSFKTKRRKAKITSDVSVFIKLREPLAKDRFIYLLMGNQTQGTYGAACMFGISSPKLLDNYDYLRDKTAKIGNARGFGIIARTTVIDDYAEPIELKTSRGTKLFALPLNYATKVMQRGP
jgi:hypothetical protein